MLGMSLIPARKTASLGALRRLLKGGESATLELKRSTGELREALQTVCAFLNGDGGRVVIGARPDGTLFGQQVSDKTLRPPRRIDREMGSRD